MKKILLSFIFISLLIRVNALPVAFFATDSPKCFGQNVQFTDLSSTQGFTWIDEWKWEFGDGTIVIIPFATYYNPTHQYSSAGTYNVTLTVKNNLGETDAKTLPVVIKENPIASFQAAPLMAGQVVQFTGTSLPPPGSINVVYNWNFGDISSGLSNTSTILNPAHYYNQPGDYQVSLIVEADNNCQDQKTEILTISGGGTVSGSKEIYYGDNSGSLQVIDYYGSIVKWQKKYNSGSWEDIYGTTGITNFSETPAFTGVWYYRAVAEIQPGIFHYAVPAIITVKTPPGEDKIWNGESSELWDDPNNWSCAGVPTETDNIVIPVSAAVMPHIKINGFSCHDLKLENGAVLQIDSGLLLNISGSLILQ